MKMNGWVSFVLTAMLLPILAGSVPLINPAPAEKTRILLGSWNGKATGPQGGPPTGDITVTFERDPRAGIKGRILVKAPGGAQYAGQISDVSLKNRIFSATVVFKFGETPLEAKVKGPVRGRTIEGTFSVNSKGQKMGEGTFSITKEPTAKAKK